MILQSTRLAHRVDKLHTYLARPEFNQDPVLYRKAVEVVHGSLENIEFFKLDAGTELVKVEGRNPRNDYFLLPLAQTTVHRDTSSIAG